MKKKILMTWAMWYIGSHGVVAFEKAGYEVIIVDNLINSYISTLEWIEKILWYQPKFYEYDLRNTAKLEEVFSEYNFHGVVHFAWLKAVGESCEKPLNYFDNNVIGSIRLFQCMEKYWVKNIIFSSSATVYNPENFLDWIGVKEDAFTGATTNPYGTTKFLLERILQDLAKFSGFIVMNLRYFNPVWAHPSWCIGEYPDEYPNNLLPYIMKVVCWELPHLNIFWDDYETIDGTWVRDYIDVNDLIDGHVKAYQKLEDGATQNYTNYNLWVWRGVSVLELVEITKRVTGKKIPFKLAWRRSGDIAEVFCNSEKALKELWWKATRSIEESVKNSYRFSEKIIWKK